MKPFTVPEMTFRGRTSSSAMPFFIRSPRLFIRDRKSRLHLLPDKIAKMTLKVDQGRWR